MPHTDSRWRDNPQLSACPCNYCVYYSGDAKCKAFPNGISKEVLSGKIFHDHPLPGDHGLQFKADGTPEADKAAQDAKNYAAYCDKYGI